MERTTPTLRQRWAQSRFARNVGRLAAANAVAQALPLLAAPVLSRLYAPEDFAVLALFASLSGLALAAVTLRLDWSVPNAHSEAMAAATFALGAVAMLAFTVAGAGIWALWAPGSRPEAALPAAALAMLPLVVWGGGVQQLAQGWHIRSGELTAVAHSKVVQGIATVAVPIAAIPLLPAGELSTGLVAGTLAAAWIGAFALWRQALGLPSALRRVSTHRMRRAWRRFGREAMWSTLASVMNTASFALVPLLLLRHFGAVEVGWWALMQRVALGPVSLITGAMSQGFWAEAATLVRRDPRALRDLYLRNTRRLAWVALPVTLLALAGPWYVGPLFGSAQWAPAGAVLAACAPMLAATLVGSPLSHLVIHGRQRWQAIWDALRMLLFAVTIEACGAAALGLPATVAALSAASVAVYAVLIALNLAALRAAQQRLGPDRAEALR